MKHIKTSVIVLIFLLLISTVLSGCNRKDTNKNDSTTVDTPETVTESRTEDDPASSEDADDPESPESNETDTETETEESSKSEEPSSESDETDTAESEDEKLTETDSAKPEPKPTLTESSEPETESESVTEVESTEPEPETTTQKATETTKPEPKPEPTQPDLREEGEALESILKPAQITVLRPSASGTATKSNAEALIDYSNISDGYVMAKFTQDPGVKLKVQVTGPSTTYTYNVKPYEWTVFPLSDGNGSYTVKLFRNVVDNRYSTVLTAGFNVSMKNEFAPFLRPNQYVNYENEPLTCDAASKAVSDGASMIEKVKAVYSFVVNNISYDYEKAATVSSGYLPDLDQILMSRRGICFDYAALMAGMLRSLGVPCKLVIGYAGVEYHAWISVWSEETGWIDGAIFFNGSTWQNMDPTFAATGSADSINKITYTSKYVY